MAGIDSLGIGDLNTLQRQLMTVVDRWYQFGEALKIERKTLDEFQDSDCDNKEMFFLVLYHFLSSPSVKNRTRADVVAALKELGLSHEAAVVEKSRVGARALGMEQWEESASSEPTKFRISLAKPFITGKLNHPRGLAVSGKKEIYLTDKSSANAGVRRIYNLNEMVTNIVRDPYGIAHDNDGYVYVTDCRNHRLYKFDAELNFLKKFGTGKGGRNDDQLYYPHGVGVIQGMVYVCDNGSCRIKVYDRDLKYQYSFGDREREEDFDKQLLFGPIDVAGDRKGGLYVADNKKRAVVMFRLSEGPNPPEFVRNIVHVNLQMPSGVTMDSNYIYVTDKLRNCIIVFNTRGELVTELANGIMQAPRAICCEKNPTVLYVSDRDSEINIWKCEIHL